MQMQKKTGCDRCGSCCTGSSPSLLKEDMALFVSGVLSGSNTITVRDGERVRSHGDGRTYESFMELVKVRSDEQGSACIFYNGDDGCAIYENRPSQCRQYECWTRTDLYSGLEKNALDRKDIFGSVDLLIDVIDNHEEKCSYRKLSGALQRLAAEDENAVDEIIDMLQYDTFARPLLQEKLKVPSDTLDLLLGRPMSDAVNEFGFKVVRDGDEYILMPLEDKDGG